MSTDKRLQTILQINGSSESTKPSSLYPRELYIDKDGYIYAGIPDDNNESEETNNIAAIGINEGRVYRPSLFPKYGTALPDNAENGEIFFLIEG